MAESNNHDPFEDFIKKQLPEDDFEREALEGLNRLPLPELKELKANLDERIATIHPKKNTLSWLAIAASILFVTSLSILTWYYLQPADTVVAVQSINLPSQQTLSREPLQQPSPIASDASITPEALPLKGIKNRVIPKTDELPGEDYMAPPQEALIQEKKELMASDDVYPVSVPLADSANTPQGGAAMSVAMPAANAPRVMASEAPAVSTDKAKRVLASVNLTGENCLSDEEIKAIPKKLSALLSGNVKFTPFIARVQIDSQGRILSVNFPDQNLSPETTQLIREKYKLLKIHYKELPCAYSFQYLPPAD
jgi:hypothetical protein